MLRKKLLSGFLVISLVLSVISTTMMGITAAPETHDIAVVDVTPSQTEVEIGNIVNITVVIENQGSFTETFNLTCSYDDTLIDPQMNINLTSGQSKSVVFSWDTTPRPQGQLWDWADPYKITATASTVPGETDTADNTFVSSSRVRVFEPPYIGVVPHSTVNPNLTIGTNYPVSIYTDYNGSDITSWQFTLSYNPNVLQGVKVTNGDLITNATHPDTARFISGTFNNTSGELSLTAAFFFFMLEPAPLTSGPGILANVTFKVVGLGDSSITLGDETKLIGYTEDGYGDNYNIISDREPFFFHLLNGFFQNEKVIHDVAVISVTPYPTSVVQGELVNIIVVVENQGTVAETFDVTIYRSMEQTNWWYIGTKTVSSLAVGANMSSTFTWNTKGVLAGNYNIKAVANEVPGETDTEDNKLQSDEIVTVHANAIYIRADGSVDPPTAPISSIDNVTYALTADINRSIVVERDNIVVDGAGYTLQSPYPRYYKGINLTGRSNVTIKNMEIKAFLDGICLYESSNNSISGNNITANTYCGIWLVGSSNNSISGNNITANTYCGIWLVGSSNNNISGNNIGASTYCGILLGGSSNNSISVNSITANDHYGISLSYSPNNLFKGNSITNNKYSFKVWGESLSDFVHEVDASNTVDGKPIYYWVNKRDMTVPLDAGYVALVNCTGITVQNLTLTNNWQGILLAYTTNSTITKNKITNTYYGVWLKWSSNNSIFGNKITNNEDGVWLEESANNSLSGNNITNNYAGICFFHSSSNSIFENEITNNSCGILLHGSLNNSIYHNNFLDNTEPVGSFFINLPNVWDNGYPSGGNYWSDYTGDDFYSGPYQNETGSDGIGDTPYVIDEINQDNYPLMNPWTPTPPTIVATVHVGPDKLNLKSKGKWITAHIKLPEGYDVEDIDVSTILLNDEVPAENSKVSGKKLKVRFDRESVIEYIRDVLEIKNGEVTLTITGKLTDGAMFEGNIIVNVMFRGDTN